MSVHELATLPKLRRIGLVRVTNLTDQAIYSLADRHSTLERIHLSYCENITVIAIHFLLQNLTKLTHLSLTGIPAFRRQELQQFCRSPPRVIHYISLALLFTNISPRSSIQTKGQPSVSTPGKAYTIYASTSMTSWRVYRLQTRETMTQTMMQEKTMTPAR